MTADRDQNAIYSGAHHVCCSRYRDQVILVKKLRRRDREGVKRARKTIDNVKSAWIQDQEATVVGDGKIDEYRVLMEVTFVLKD